MYLVEGNSAEAERGEQLAGERLPSAPWESFHTAACRIMAPPAATSRVSGSSPWTSRS